MPQAKQRSTASTNDGATVGYEARALADGRRAARQHGRRRVQARRPRPDLPQVHLRRLRGAARASSRPSKAQGADPEDPDEYRAAQHLLGAARGALGAPEGPGQAADHRQDRRRRDGRHRARQPLAQGRAAQGLRPPRARQAAARPAHRPRSATSASATRRAASKDVLGRVYEYFLSQFASAEGKKGGEFYTPRCVVKLLVEMLEPYKGRVYDPCCGSGGHVRAVGGVHPRARQRQRQRRQGQGDISIYGQESNYTTWRLRKMNLAIRGIDGQIAHGDTFHNDRHPDLQGRLHPRQPAVQRQRLGRRAAARRQALAVRRAAGRQRQLRLGAAHRPPPGARRAWPASCWPTARCRRTSRRGRDPQGI